MKEEQDYIRNIAEIRSMMERSSKFLSLSGWAGIMAGIYALIGAYIAHNVLHFNPGENDYDGQLEVASGLQQVIILALIILLLSIATAVYFSWKNADKRGERLWNPTSKRLLMNMAVPLVSGGLLVLVLISKHMIEFVAPFTLLFYGLALYNAGKFTYPEVKNLGLVEIALGLISTYFVGFGLIFWAFGFGVVHIIYGIYMHYRYER
jgi:hypothetical protein